MQHELLVFLRNKKCKFTARELKEYFKVRGNRIRMALFKLWKNDMVEREGYVNQERHFEYKYWAV